jgi:hypothetical protein
MVAHHHVYRQTETHQLKVYGQIETHQLKEPSKKIQKISFRNQYR